MKILYISNSRMPTEKAHGWQIIKMCESFAKAGIEVELVLPRRFNPEKKNVFEYYNVAPIFKITKIACIDVVRVPWLGRYGFHIENISFSFFAALYSWWRRADIIYGRDELPLYFISLARPRAKIALEIHYIPERHNYFYGKVLKRMWRIISTNHWKRQYICQSFSVQPHNTLVFPNAIEPSAFAQQMTQMQARKKLDLPLDGPIIMYTGHLYDWKGAQVLADAVPLILKNNPMAHIVFVGGAPKHVETFKKQFTFGAFSEVLVLGHKPHAEIALYLHAADVVVLPNKPVTRESVYETSPIKLLEYMAAGKAIVASDLPAIRELVAQKCAVLFEAGNAVALARAVDELLLNPAQAKILADCAKKEAQMYSWQNRAEAIITFMSNPVHNKKIKILSIYRGKLSDARGTPIRVKSIINELIKEPQFEMSVASWDDSSFAKQHLVGLSESQFITLSNNHIEDIARLNRYIAEQKIDVIIGHTMSSSYYLWPLSLVTSAKIVLEMHGFIEEESKLYGDIGVMGYWLNKALFALFYWSCDLITTCSKTAAEILQKYNKNTIGVFGGVDLSIFNPDVPSGQFFKKDDRLVIGYAGNSRIWQGLPFLVETFKEYYKQNNKCRLVILSSESRELTESHPAIEQYGPLPHEKVPQFLIDCDVLVIPRPDNTVNKISFPSKLIEFMAMAKTVIASKTSDAHFIIEHGVDGLLYEPGDKKGLLDAFASAQDRALRVKLGLAAFEKIRNHFTWHNQTSIISQAIKRLEA